jgi:hypothetical protein
MKEEVEQYFQVSFNTKRVGSEWACVRPRKPSTLTCLLERALEWSPEAHLGGKSTPPLKDADP